MNQSLLDQLWNDAINQSDRLQQKKEPEALQEAGYEISVISASQGDDYMILRFLIEGYPEWHYRRKSPDGLWQSVIDCRETPENAYARPTQPAK